VTNTGQRVAKAASENVSLRDDDKSTRISFALGGRAYMLASRFSWWIGLTTAAIIFFLVPHWYISLPVAAVSFGLTTAMCGVAWATITNALSWKAQPDDDYRHLWFHRSAMAALVPASIVGIAGFVYIPNWTDFQFNGHRSVVAVTGSLVLGLVALTWGFGITAWIITRMAALGLGLCRQRLSGKP
jgi:hypothetical protein